VIAERVAMGKLLIEVVAVFALLLSSGQSAPTSEGEIVVAPNTPQNIERLKNIRSDDLAEELSGQYQGDIIISEQQLKEYESGKSGKTGLIAERYRWPNGVVPYRVIESHFNQEQVDYIHLGAQRLGEVTCLKFIAYDPNVHEDFITVQGTGSGCYSSVGRRGGEQTLNLQPYDVEVGCFRLMTIAHEFIHAVGFYHMQSATDRDDYVRIEFDKIQAGTANNFNKYGFDVITHFNVEYDYGSVMHYGRTAFSVDGSDTIIALRDLNGEVMGQRVRLSEKDIQRLNNMYNCEPVTETPTPSPTTSSPPRPNPGAELAQTILNFARNLLNNILRGFGL